MFKIRVEVYESASLAPGNKSVDINPDPQCLMIIKAKHRKPFIIKVAKTL